jgi:hypothetical protein
MEVLSPWSVPRDQWVRSIVCPPGFSNKLQSHTSSDIAAELNAHEPIGCFP